MVWVRFDDRFLDHPKVQRAGRDPILLHLAAMLWAGGHVTNGQIVPEILRALAAKAWVSKPRQLAERLVEVGLWERTEGGYAIHDFLEYNPSREKVEANRDRVNKWREKKGDKPVSRAGKASQNGSSNGLHAAHETRSSAVEHGTRSRTHDPSPSPLELQPSVDPPETGTAGARPEQAEPESSGAEQDAAEPIPILQRLAYEVADQLGVPRQRRGVWVDLSVLYQGADLDPPTFETRAERALAQIRGKKHADRRGQYRAALKQVLEV